MTHLIKSLRIIRRIVGITLEWFFASLMIFWCCNAILSRIGVGPTTVTAEKPVTIYITSNGVHTDVVVPIRSTQFNWVRELNLPDSLLADTSHNWLAFGWGDKGFFLETKSWSDLKVSVALKAAFHLGHSAMHLVLVRQPETGRGEVIELHLTRTQYADLIHYLRNSFDRNGTAYQPIAKHPYGRYNYFFEARRSYGLTYTCNSWTNGALKSAGQRACVWTAFKDGIFLQYGNTH